MVTSNQKGARGETVIRDKLRELTGLPFERVPGSGALDPKHQLKGDIYLVGINNIFCIECKNYTDEQFDSKILSSKNPQLIQFWQQAVRQGVQTNRKPLLLFKFDRSKIFAAYADIPNTVDHVFISIGEHSFYISLLEQWIKQENPKFT
jgi:hypothetical protein